ncbi:hypothetical protein pb186bvf_003313, partial [Paramecium bursaria]
GQMCQYLQNLCQNIVIKQYKTECDSLTNVNQLACSQVFIKRQAESEKDGCYWDDFFYKCVAFNDQPTDSEINKILCLTPGLNQIGCSIVQKEGQQCRWIGGTCTLVSNRSDLAKIPCINLKYVNKYTCSLATFGQVPCSYVREYLGCVTSYNTNIGKCDDPGVNQFACGAIKSASCLYNSQTQSCQQITDIQSPGPGTKALLAQASCLSNAPTEKVCLSISTPGQQCVWLKNFQRCSFQTVQYNFQCTQFKNVNQSVCASVLMDLPDGIVGDKIVTETNLGYCVFDAENYACIKYTSTDICANACCSDQAGINAHVCSRNSRPSDYCYFQGGTCKKFDGSSEDDFKKFINDQKLTCSSVPVKYCKFLNWSTSQQCYATWSLLPYDMFQTYACVNINYDNYDDLYKYFVQPNTVNGAIVVSMNIWTCLGIKGKFFGTNDYRYFYWDPAPMQCKQYGGSLSDKTCTSSNTNINVCTGKTTNIDCMWDEETFTCKEVTDLTTLINCSSNYNQFACLKVNAPCKYLKSSNQCIISRDYEVNCKYYDDGTFVTSLTCQQITKDGQSCILAASGATPPNVCVEYDTQVDGCDVGNANSQACYAYTNSDCRWDTANLQCYQQLDVGSVINTLKCVDNVNKNLCLKLTKYPCYWDTAAKKCKYFANFATCPPSTDNNFYTASACLSVSNQGCSFNKQTSTCLPLTTIAGCGLYSVNRFSCLRNTDNIYCQYDESLPPQNRCHEFYDTVTKCETANINYQSCQDAKLTCYFDTSDNNCKTQLIDSSTTCSYLMSLSARLYNIYSCISISPSNLQQNISANFCAANGDENLTSSCLYEKYCQWSLSTQTCSTITLGSGTLSLTKDVCIYVSDGDGGTTPTDCVKGCAILTKSFLTCNPYFSKAACINLVSDKCFFDVNAGGCQPLDNTTSEDTLYYLTCDSVTDSACSQIDFKNMYCTKGALLPILATCALTASKFNTQSCVYGYPSPPTCSSMSSLGGCSKAQDDCYYNSGKCAIPDNAKLLTLKCEKNGLSKSACLQLPQCTYQNFLCQFKFKSINIYNTCAQAVLLTSDAQTQLYTCCSVKGENCTFDGAACSKVDTAKLTKDNQDGKNTNAQTCVSVTDKAMQWDSINYQCHAVTSGVNSCDYLNQIACQTLTSKAFCFWDTTSSQCLQYTISQIMAQKVCTNLGAKSCMYASIPCYLKDLVCTAADSTQQCSDITTGNSLSCQLATDDCVWNSVIQKCQKVGNDIYPCDQQGLSKQSCIFNTFGKDSKDRQIQNSCIFDAVLGCRYTLSADVTVTANVGMMNKFACLAMDVISSWDTSGCEIKTTTSDYKAESDQTCSNFLNTDKVGYSVRACKTISAPGKACYQNAQGLCEDVTKEQICAANGLNKFACLTKTKGYCYFDSDKFQCLTLVINTSLKVCNPLYNKYSCTQVNNSCYFKDNICQDFKETVSNVSDANTKTQLANVVYSNLVCSSIKIPGSFLIYNAQTLQCQTMVSKTALCTDIGLSMFACLQNTSQNCVFVEGQGCQQISGFILQGLKQCGLDKGNDNKYLNWKSCLSIPLNPPCIFDTSLLNGCKQSSVKACSFYVSPYIVQPSVCAMTTDTPCNYNSVTQQCEIVQNTITKICSDLGLNNQSCQLNTTTSQCIFNTTTNVCFAQSSTDQSFYTCSSTYLMNKINCINMRNAQQYCYINNNFCSAVDTNSAFAKTCLKPSNQIVNARVCSLATDKNCQYNDDTDTCKEQAPTTCVQTADNQKMIISLNRIGCLQTDITDSCKWSNSQCQSLASGDLSVLKCTDGINKSACKAITTNQQYCQFTSDKTCILLSLTPTTPYSCATLTNINNGRVCVFVADSEACGFDSTNNKCVIISATSSTCDNTFSKKACAEKTDPALNCQFVNNICYIPTAFLNCQDAKNQNDCMNNFDNTSCTFKDGKCQIFQTNVSCGGQVLVNPYSCTLLSVPTIINTCKEKKPDFSCEIITPVVCEGLPNKESCIFLPGIPCLWDDNNCSFHKATKDEDNCQTYNGIGSIRSCLDIKKFGQMCQFTDLKCLNFSKFTTGCTADVNYNACVAQQDFSCIWDIQKVTANGGPYDLGTCKPYVLNPNDKCNENLSYQSCLQITFQGQFCQWTSNYCTQVDTKKLPKKIPINFFSQISPNVCGLVTVGAAQYNSDTKICEESTGITQCQTVGINRTTCISAKDIRCKWDSANFVCHDLVKSRLLAEITQCSDLSDVSPQVCQEITLNMPCAFSEGSCIAMPSDATCTDPGLNEFACVNVKTTPCIWLDGSCEDYYPIVSCLEVPELVNQIVCSLVDMDACKYNSSSKSCDQAGGESKCDVLGINFIGCSQIDNCIFKDKCQLQSTPVSCEDAQLANYKVCENSFEKCKYSSLNYGCIATTLTDLCSSQGLSQLSCFTLVQCDWQNNGCRCIQYTKLYPQCSTVKSYSDCKSFDYCYFQIETVTSQKDITTYLQNQNYGKCRDKQCSDTDCSSTVNGKQCYLDKNLICQSASSCKDIINYSTLNYGSCSNFLFNKLPCQQSQNYQCQDLNCTQLQFQECQQYSKYCFYEQTCQTRTCSKYDQVLCLININSCDWTGSKCQNQQPCNAVTVFSQCNSKLQINNRCGWVIQDKAEFCVNNPCRYMGVTQSQCTGTQIVDQVCVMLSDMSCVSCEEIVDQCTCLSQDELCGFDRLKNACYSRPCESYSQVFCPDRCRYIGSKQSCLPTCQYIYNSNDCLNAPKCNWDFFAKICFDYDPIIPPPRIILPKVVHSALIMLQLLILMI